MSGHPNAFADHVADPFVAAVVGAWRSAGGASATFQEIVDTNPQTALCSVRVGGDWSYYFCGDEHNRRNGLQLSGLFERQLPAENFIEVRGQLEQIIDATVPYRFTAPGFVGKSDACLVERISMPVLPPDGADAAIISFCRWHDTINLPRLPIFEEAVRDVYGVQALHRFYAPRGANVSEKIRLLKGLVGALPHPPSIELIMATHLIERLFYANERLLCD